MASRGRSDTAVANPATSLVATDRRAAPDDSGVRNALTSIYYLPTSQAPMLLAKNASDHVHYHLDGRPFVYRTIDPATGVCETQILGRNLAQGQTLQVVVPGGMWKCGHVLVDSDDSCDFSLIAEAVAPGFDSRDFAFVTRKELFEVLPPGDLRDSFEKYLVREDTRIGPDLNNFHDGVYNESNAQV
ncbi:hypothetical protein HDU83_008703 [Entophlyctis luteolus]|nr:hypothetical protein HDU83_008703 [Entophlyctis luteolus]